MALSSVSSLPTPQKSLLPANSMPKHLLQPLAKPIQSSKQRKLVMCCTTPIITPFSPAIRTAGPRVQKKRKIYRKLNPGEKEGITEEMRFVTMKLRNIKGRYVNKSDSGDSTESESVNRESEDSTDDESENRESEDLTDGEEENGGATWTPTIEGFVKHLVDTKLVFETVERIVDQSSDVAYVYFRNTGLERTEHLSRDLEWFRQQGVAIPEPSKPGVTYAAYLEEIAVKSAPFFLCHFYNIYFSHIAGGKVIGEQVCMKILDGKELELYQWKGDVSESLRKVRENLNNLGEHWERKVKNKCLSETKRSFQYLGEIVRLIIL